MYNRCTFATTNGRNVQSINIWDFAGAKCKMILHLGLAGVLEFHLNHVPGGRSVAICCGCPSSRKGDLCHSKALATWQRFFPLMPRA
jgi:hypothetical protein